MVRNSVYGEKVFRNDGEVYELSPYALFWNDDNYYVVWDMFYNADIREE